MIKVQSMKINKPTPTIDHVVAGERALQISWTNGQHSTFHYFSLRDNCPQLRHASTDHRVVETSSLPADVRPTQAGESPPRANCALFGSTIITKAALPRLGCVPTTIPTRCSGHAASQPCEAAIGAQLPKVSYPALLQDSGIEQPALPGAVP